VKYKLLLENASGLQYQEDGIIVELSTTVVKRFFNYWWLSYGAKCSVPLLSAQNAVPPNDMAVASSTINFFQSVSGLLSTSIGQTILNNRAITLMTPIINELKAYLPPGTPMDSQDFDIKKLLGTPLEPFYHRILDAYVDATTRVFWVSLICGAIALAASFFMKHIPLRDGINADAVHVEGVPPPPIDDTDDETTPTETKTTNAGSSSPKNVVVKVTPVETTTTETTVTTTLPPPPSTPATTDIVPSQETVAPAPSSSV